MLFLRFILFWELYLFLLIKSRSGGINIWTFLRFLSNLLVIFTLSRHRFTKSFSYDFLLFQNLLNFLFFLLFVIDIRFLHIFCQLFLQLWPFRVYIWTFWCFLCGFVCSLYWFGVSPFRFFIVVTCLFENLLYTIFFVYSSLKTLSYSLRKWLLFFCIFNHLNKFIIYF